MASLRPVLGLSLLALAAPAAVALADIPQGSPAEAHHQLAQMHEQHAMDHLQALYQHATHASAVDAELAREHIHAAGEHLTAGQRHVDAEEQAMSEEDRARAHAQLEQIRAAHQEAAEHQHELEADSTGATMDGHAMGEHAAAEYRAMHRAHDAEVAMGRRVGMHAAVVVPPERAAGRR